MSIARRRLGRVFRRRADATTVRPTPTASIADEVFVRELVRTGDVATAVIAVIRSLLNAKAIGRARTVAQAFQLGEGTRSIGDMGLALVAVRDRAWKDAWALLAPCDIEIVLRVCAPEFLRAAFAADPPAALHALDQVRRGEAEMDLGPRVWLDVARWAFAAGAEDHSAWALDRAVERSGRLDPAGAGRICREAAWMRTWFGRAAKARESQEVPAGQIPFAVLDYKQPDRSRSSSNLGDPVQTLASLGHLARRPALSFVGDGELPVLVGELQKRVPADRQVDGPSATVRLYTVDRDASSFAAVPDGTWSLVFGWFMHPLLGARFDLPLQDRIRPIFVSFHVNVPELLTPEVLDYLRRHGPIGCRDHNTVQLLLAADIPAFFSGCLTTTIDALFPRDPEARPDGTTLFVDVPAPRGGIHLEQDFDLVRDRSLTENLRDALQRVQSFRDRHARVVTSRLHCYLPARSIGANVEFHPKNRANVRLDGLLDLDAAKFDAMRGGIERKIAAVLDAICSGASTEEVYAAWQRICAPDVAAARSLRASIAPIESGDFDVAATCARIRARSTTVERSQPGPDGPEINLEFSLDGNLRHQLAVALGAVVARSSRPIRAFVLCRDHGPADHVRLARLFPTVSFVWLPTDSVDYGALHGLIAHITVATMDRLLVPDLLPEADRIVHHDLDALCLADPAELFDVDLAGQPLAARTSPHPAYQSGFLEFIRSSERLDRARASELIARTHARHRFDFVIFNAGIMVLDLARMRSDEFGTRFLPFALRFGLNDQAVLNAYAGPSRVALDAAWNWHPRLERMDDPKIVHWAGPLKPWGPHWVHARELWRAAEADLARFETAAAQRQVVDAKV